MTKLEQLREAVRLREKATEGPWDHETLDMIAYCAPDDDLNSILANANLDLPAILAVVEAAEWAYEVRRVSDYLSRAHYSRDAMVEIVKIEHDAMLARNEALAALGKE